MFSIGLVYYSGIENVLGAMQGLLHQHTNDGYEILFRDHSLQKEGILLLNTHFLEEIKTKKIRIWNGENSMHSGGHNFLYSQKKYPYYIVASIDMWYEKTMLADFASAIATFPDAKVWGGKILQMKNNCIDSVGIEKKWYGQFTERGFGKNFLEYNVPEKVFGVSGALFCIHSSALEPNETLFEPSLHYKNDVELMLRLEKKKYQVQYFPQILARHYRMASKNNKKSLFILQSSLQGQIFIMQYLPWPQKIFAFFLIFLQKMRLFIFLSMRKHK